ncbi:uncharacterized protein LOC119372502 [Rhipicephalus sanguineus]|uniref:THAP-type domain-containing protein n=1 Tax=Rhipicephalus sanguineus TaxID=34632 RepID=A0A9D4QEC2_RHISA|nr:uncharacterized protein LOC119372502 [Rhipicephalus sanguineus]KAH7975619.1 hypothetical protein HPB52_003715 [Rhipicephalus sanguineus]
MRCFVPGCNTRYAIGGKSSCSMFRPPADPDLRRRWELNIGRTDRGLTRNDKVCSLHFEKRFVSDRYYNVHAGNVLLNEGKLPRLRRDAVPTIFDDHGVCGCGGVQRDSSAVAASQWPPVEAQDTSNESQSSAETKSRLNADADVQCAEPDGHRVSVKREDGCPSDESHSRNTELCAEGKKIADLSDDRNVRIKVEKDERCSDVQNPEDVLHGEDRPLIRPVCDVDSDGARVDCGVEVKKEPEECVDEPQVPRIVCAVGSFYNTSTTPGVAQRVLAKHLVRHPEAVKLPFTWNYHKVSALRWNRVVYSTVAVASDGTTPVITKFVNVTTSRGHKVEPVEPFEAFVLDRNLNVTLGDLAKPTTIEEVERMVEAVDRLPTCRGGPCKFKYPDVDIMHARVDVLGVWRRVDCEVYGTTLCRHCAKLEPTLRQNACRKRKGKKEFSRLRISLESLEPAQRYKVELLQRRCRCLLKRIRRLKAGGRELCGKDDGDSQDDDDDSGESENEMECPEAHS